MQRGRLVSRKHDAHSNPVGHAHANPRMYVPFSSFLFSAKKVTVIQEVKELPSNAFFPYSNSCHKGTIFWLQKGK